jgi:nucleoside-diphosphate-sugar epimerase
VIVPAATPVARAAEQVARGQTGQPQALPGEVCVVGVPGLGGQVGHLTLPAGRPPGNHLDISRLRADTGFRPGYDVERAVPDYAAWLRRHDH